jgi:hypothetical protein
VEAEENFVWLQICEKFLPIIIKFVHLVVGSHDAFFGIVIILAFQHKFVGV